jgi:hypothetical protein
MRLAVRHVDAVQIGHGTIDTNDLAKGSPPILLAMVHAQDLRQPSQLFRVAKYEELVL